MTYNKKQWLMQRMCISHFAFVLKEEPLAVHEMLPFC